jgi:hypothetical protein
MSPGVPGPGDLPLVFLSWSVLLSLLIALGIIFIGIREFFQPSVGASQFGVPLLDAGVATFSPLKQPAMLLPAFCCLPCSPSPIATA